jgi:hypothetical protein
MPKLGPTMQVSQGGHNLPNQMTDNLVHKSNHQQTKWTKRVGSAGRDEWKNKRIKQNPRNYHGSDRDLEPIQHRKDAIKSRRVGNASLLRPMATAGGGGGAGRRRRGAARVRKGEEGRGALCRGADAEWGRAAVGFVRHGMRDGPSGRGRWKSPWETGQN